MLKKHLPFQEKKMVLQLDLSLPAVSQLPQTLDYQTISLQPNC